MPKKAEMEIVSLDLSRPQIRKLSGGKCCQLKPSQMSGGAVSVALTPAKVRKLRRAREKQKGLRLRLSPEEIEKSGEGFKEVLQKVKSGLKKGYEGYKKKVKPVVGPVVKKGLKEVIKKGLPALAIAVGQPELAIPAKFVADAVADKAVDALGQKTGAFGIRKKKLKDDYSQFQAPEHPAMSPALPHQDFSRPDPSMMRGKGLNVSTGAKTRVSYGGRLHPALQPVLPMHDFSRPTTGGSFLPAGGSFKPAGF